MYGNLSPEELQAAQNLKANGGSLEDARALIVSMRRSPSTTTETPSGKTSLSSRVGGILSPFRERVEIGGRDYAERLNNRALEQTALQDRYQQSDKGLLAKAEMGTQWLGNSLAAGVLDPMASTIKAVPGAEQAFGALGAGVGWLSQTKPIKALGDMIGDTKTLQEVVNAYDTDQNFRSTLDNAFNIVLAGTTVYQVGSALEKTPAQATVERHIQTAKDTTAQMGDDFIQKHGGVTAQIESTKNNIEMGLRAEGLADDATKIGQLDVSKYSTLDDFADDAMKVTDKVPPVQNAVPPATASKATQAAGQYADDVSSRINRIKEHVGQNIDDAAARAEKIKNAPTPAIADGYRVGLADDIINRASSADDATKEAMANMLDIAEEGARGSRTMSVPAEYAARQYELLDKTRAGIGTKLGEAIDNIPDVTVDMRPAYSQVDDLLGQNGISVKNGKLNFSQSSLAPEARTAVQKAYDLLHEAGDVVDAKVVHSKDSLFSNFNRELRTAGQPPVLVSVNGETRNIFDVLRDVYRSPLDNISPEIRGLNQEYAIYRTMVDLTDETVFKTAKLNGIEIDPAAQAAVNLRRLDTEALSQPAFLSVTRKLDDMARQNGYVGPKPEELVYFSNDIRPLFPNSSTVAAPGGFYGSIRSAVSGVADRLLKMGAVTPEDQLKALREILGEQVSAGGVSGSSANASRAIAERLRNNPQGGYVTNPFIRDTINSVKPSNPLNRNLTAEARIALKAYPNGDPGAREILQALVDGKNYGKYTRSEIATAVDILTGKKTPSI